MSRCYYFNFITNKVGFTQLINLVTVAMVIGGCSPCMYSVLISLVPVLLVVMSVGPFEIWLETDAN
jgi:hypothetical protein